MIIFYYNDNKQNNNKGVKTEEIDRIFSHIERASESNIDVEQCEIDTLVEETSEHKTNNFSKNLRLLRKSFKLKQENLSNLNKKILKKKLIFLITQLQVMKLVDVNLQLKTFACLQNSSM